MRLLNCLLRLYTYRCIIILAWPLRMQRKEHTNMKNTQLRNVKKGDFFKCLTKGQPQNRVYVKDYYDRELKAFWCYPYDDVNAGRFIKATTIVNIGFTF